MMFACVDFIFVCLHLIKFHFIINSRLAKSIISHVTHFTDTTHQCI